MYGPCGAVKHIPYKLQIITYTLKILSRKTEQSAAQKRARQITESHGLSIVIIGHGDDFKAVVFGDYEYVAGLVLEWQKVDAELCAS